MSISEPAAAQSWICRRKSRKQNPGSITFPQARAKKRVFFHSLKQFQYFLSELLGQKSEFKLPASEILNRDEDRSLLVELSQKSLHEIMENGGRRNSWTMGILKYVIIVTVGNKKNRVFDPKRSKISENHSIFHILITYRNDYYVF